jgi:lipid-A-disaccharide synthase
MADCKPCSILFIAGDASGDIYTARLARRLAERRPGWILHALGGRHLGAAIEGSGGRWIGDTTHCSAIGLVSALAIYPRGKILSRKMRRFVRSRPVDAVVLCDWGGFNCSQLEFFKKLGIPVLYYFPPRSWQRTGMPGLHIAPFVNRVATPFEWSARRLANAGCRAEWVGHPLLESRENPPEREALRREFGAGDGEKLIALFPGSRPPEIRVLAPRMAAAAELLRYKYNARFVAPVSRPLLERARSIFPAYVKVVEDRAGDVLRACDVAVVKTGTATLEAAVIGAPQVAVYDVDWLGRLEWALLWMWKRIPFIAMPNIILQRMAVPELLGLECHPAAIAYAAGELLENDIQRHRMMEDYGEIRRQLGGDLPFGATERTVEMLEDMAGGGPTENASARHGAG